MSRFDEMICDVLVMEFEKFEVRNNLRYFGLFLQQKVVYVFIVERI